MKKVLTNIFSHSFFVIAIALGAGILAMVGFVHVYDYLWGEVDVAEVENPVERALNQQQPRGPVETLNVRGVVGPFVDPADQAVWGMVFLHVALDIDGESNFEAAKDSLDRLKPAFMKALNEKGVGREDLPGEIDFERLAKLFLEVARDEIDLKGIVLVRVTEEPSEDEETSRAETG